MNTKLPIAALIGAIIATPTFAADPTPAQRKTVTSVNYVTTQIGTRQAKIPVSGTNQNTPGASVVMYTGTAGTIGERQLFTGSSTYTSGDANKLVTADALDYRANHLPTIETSKLTCANQADGCTLWTVDDQTVYGSSNSNNNGDN